MLSYFYSDLLIHDQKHLSKNLYKTGLSHLGSWIYRLTNLRNSCAHYSTIFYFNFKSIPKMPKECNYEVNEQFF